MSSPDLGSTIPFSFPLPPIHTFEHLLSTLNALNQQCDFSFSASLLSRLQQVTIQLSSIRYLLDCKLRSRLSSQEMQFYAGILECLTDIEELGVEGWVKWIEMQQRAQPEGAAEARTVRKTAPKWMGNFRTEGEGEMTVNDRYAPSLQHQGVRPAHTTMEGVFDEEGPRRRSETESSPDAYSMSSSPCFRYDTPRNVHIQSKQAEVGSPMSGRIGRKRKPWTHSKNQSRSEYPPHTASVMDRNTNRLDSEQDYHEDDLEWKDEAKHIYEYKNPRHMSPSKRKESQDQIGPYLHIPLPDGITIPDNDLHSCPITFTGPSSIFYFPLGISSDQLLSYLHNGRLHGRMAPSSEVGNMNITKICTLGMKRELQKTISKTGILFNLVDKNRVVKVGGPWDEENQGDIYIVSGPEHKLHFQNIGIPGLEQDKYVSTAETESYISSVDPPLLRGGSIASSWAPDYFIPPPTTVGSSDNLLADHFPDKANAFYWMQEAHTLQLKLSDVQDKYHQLQKKRENIRGVLVNENNESRRFDGLLKEIGYWIYETLMARANEEKLKRELSRQNLAIRTHRKAVDDMNDSANRVVGLIKDLKAALRNEGLLQQSPNQMTTWCGCHPSRHPEERTQEKMGIAALQNSKTLKDPSTLRGGGSSSNTTPLILPELLPGNGDQVTRGIEATGFYFFPSVATIATQSEPIHYFQWPYGTTLMQIRNSLRNQRLKGNEDHPVLFRIREILQQRDELRIPDPDTSTGNPVSLCIPSNTNPDSARLQSKVGPSGEFTDESVKEWFDSAKGRQFNVTGTTNLSRGDDVESDFHLIVNQASDSDSESRFKSIGNLINLLNYAVDDADEYEHKPSSEFGYIECPEDTKINFRDPWSSSGDNGYHNIPPLSPLSARMQNHQTELDEKVSNSRLEVISRELSRFGQVDEHTVQDTDYLPKQLERHSLHSSRYKDSYEILHAKGQGCESWTGYLDPRRDRCTYCDLAFVELEPHRSASQCSSIASYGLTPESPTYRSSSNLVDPYLRGGADVDTCMTTSWPSKVCTNPFAEPPIENKKWCRPTSFSSLNEMFPFISSSNRHAVPLIWDDTTPLKVPDSVASTSPFSLPCSYKTTKSKGNLNPEQGRDYYRRQAEEPTIQERIQKVEALTCELIQLTQRCEETELMLERLVRGRKTLVEPTAQVLSPPSLLTSIDIKDPLPLPHMEHSQRGWERGNVIYTTSQAEDRAASEATRTKPSSKTFKGRPTSRAKSPWMGDIEDAVDYIVPPSISSISDTLRCCGGSKQS